MKNFFECIALIGAWMLWEVLILWGKVIGEDQS